MWRRVHLATIDGPDPGIPVELGAAGRGIRPAQAVSVGRGEFVDQQILDPHLSRHHFRARAGIGRFGLVGVWVDDGTKERHLRVGARYRAGGSTFEVRTDVPPRRFRAGSFAALLPLVAGVGLLTMWVVPGAGPWPLLLTALAAPAGMMIANSRGAGPLPDPARLHRGLPGTRTRPAPDAGGGETDSWRVETGNLRHRRSIEVRTGQTVGIAGAGAVGMGRWISAQLIAAGAAVHIDPGEDLTGFTLAFPAGEEVTVLAARSPALLPPHTTHALPTPAGHNREVGEHWFAAFRALVQGSDLPEVAHLSDLLPEPAELVDTWSATGDGLCVPVGVTVSGDGVTPFEIDLGATPHAVVAGTTGSGKSELLTSWLCQIASRYPPARVAMVLVDYKGGATFGPLTRLPHVLDVLTDLDHPATVRALESLRVEIHRRERILQTSGSLNLVEHNAHSPEPLARLLIVVDEFRVLADEYPPLLEQLVRVAAQGRSLGIHVVLATQRPGGTMTPDIRANMGVRVCLRVVEETDSMDLIGSAAAAHLPAVPGRMIVQTEERQTVQALWAGDRVGAIVETCVRAAADAPHLVTAHRPWADPLPGVLPLPPPAPPGSITLGLADLPHEQRLAPWVVPVDARVLVSGESGSGRSSALRVLGAGAAGTGRAVHTISPVPLLDEGVGSWVSPEDAPACVALLEAIARAGADSLLVDDLEALLESLDHALGPAQGAALLQRTFRSLRRQGRFVAVSSTVPAPSWVEGFERVVFPPADTHKRLLAGIPQEVTGPPGRALVVREGREIHVQFAREPAARRVGDAPLPEPEFRIRPLPTRVDLPDPELWTTPGDTAHTDDAGGTGVIIGVGGTDLRPVVLPCSPGRITAVVGPDGSGKSTLLEVISVQVRARGDGGTVAVVDDAHRLDPTSLDALERRAASGEHLVVALTPEGRTSIFHPLMVRLRGAEHAVYLGEMSAAEIGMNLARYVAPDVTGRGVLAQGGSLLPVQVYAAPEPDTGPE